MATPLTKAIVHPDKEPCVVGTWVVDAVCKAVEIDYSFLNVLEFREYSVMRFEKDTN